MELQKNQTVTVRIESITSEGMGVAKPEGLPVFIPYTAVGDLAKIQIVKRHPTYAYGRVQRVIEPSPDRVEPDCAAFGKCGGCQLRHLKYTAESESKKAVLEDAFRRIGKFNKSPETFLAAEDPNRYRNKAQIPFGVGKDGSPVYGFYAPRSHRIVSCSDCKLQPKGFGEIAKVTAEYLRKNKIPCYNEVSGKGVFRHLYLRQSATGQILVCFVVTKSGRLQGLAEELMKEFPEICGVTENINSARTNVILGEKTLLLTGSDSLQDSLCGVPLSLSPHAFYQINHAQTERLYHKAAEYAELRPTDLLLDLYCGVGSIGLSMARQVSRLIGVEIIPQAVENATENAEKMGLTNTRFVCGDAGTIAGDLAEQNLHPDVILLDPPRKGCDEACLKAVEKMSPRTVVMISCHPATAARDCRRLEELGFTLDRYSGVDLFPRTRHIEAVIQLSKK